MDDLVKVDKKTQTLIFNILEREYVCRNSQQLVASLSSRKNTSSGKKDSNKKYIDPFNLDSYYNDMPMKMIRKNRVESEETDNDFDFSFHCFSHK